MIDWWVTGLWRPWTQALREASFIFLNEAQFLPDIALFVMLAHILDYVVESPLQFKTVAFIFVCLGRKIVPLFVWCPFNYDRNGIWCELFPESYGKVLNWKHLYIKDFSCVFEWIIVSLKTIQKQYPHIMELIAGAATRVDGQSNRGKARAGLSMLL